jgi:hypothetical protein
MDSLKTILYTAIAIDVGLAIFIIYLVKGLRAKQNAQNEQGLIRRQQLLEQGKIIAAQESLLKSKQELLQEKDKLIKEYRKIIE